MIKYGLPYQGSKKRIADDIIAVLPEADNFYDLFAGGCAITHCALLSGKWKNIMCNDIQDAPQLFKDAINGKYENERRWISREQFHAEKAVDPYIRWVWSFGNDGRDYLFGKNVEPVKKAAHEYLFKNGYDGTKEKRIELIRRFKNDCAVKGRFELEQLERLERLERLQQLQQLQQLERLERLERLQQLQQLQQLERLQQLTIMKKDYRAVRIKKNSIIYCDIPYAQKDSKEEYYGISFDGAAFYQWARDSRHPVYFSSVYAPKDFKVVWKKKTQCLMNNKNSRGRKVIEEKLFWNGVKL